jgi:glutathione synthase/RimK-type ligase-like ATP-grasp enzyme
MAQDSDARLAILSPGDREARTNTTTETSRFADLFRAFGAKRIHVEPAIYHDDFCEEAREQLMQVDGVLVWVNPIEGGRDRSVLDSMLRDVAAAGVFVSAHPDVILKLGTKEVLYRTRNLGWGCDTYLYASLDQMVQELPLRLTVGKPRVLKQHRGNGGNGVWKVQQRRLCQWQRRRLRCLAAARNRPSRTPRSSWLRGRGNYAGRILSSLRAVFFRLRPDD